jgi:hypothetical protein
MQPVLSLLSLVTEGSLWIPLKSLEKQLFATISRHSKEILKAVASVVGTGKAKGAELLGSNPTRSCFRNVIEQDA